MSIKDAEELGRELRSGSSVFLRRRPRMLGLTLLSSTALIGVALYQIGILQKLAQPRWRPFSTEKVNGSAEAYSMLSLPDSLLWLASYAVTACLVGAGPDHRSQSNPWLTIAMGLKLLADATVATKLTVHECWSIRAFSVWSLLAPAATFTALPLALPEVQTALNHLVRRNA